MVEHLKTNTVGFVKSISPSAWKCFIMKKREKTERKDWTNTLITLGMHGDKEVSRFYHI